MYRGVQVYKIFLAAGVALFAVALLVLRFELFFLEESQQTLPLYIGHTAEVSGVVINDPERRATSLYAYVRMEEVDGHSGSGTLLAVLPRDVALSYGDRVVLVGKISKPEVFETATGRIFDYPNYLRARGIGATIKYATVENVTPGGISLRGTLFSVKHFFEKSLERALPEPNASLLEGILLGERRGIPADVTNTFVVSGLIHVVVLSGYNISIVAEAFLRALSFLPRTLGFLSGGVMMILFALLTGGGATTLRASIMGLIAILARYLNRPTSALRALCVAAYAMVLWNPLSLIYDPSFILSVLATFGLITLSPWVEVHLPKFFNRVPSIKSIAASTTAVQIFILPALLYFTGILSFFALPANILALPIVPLVMLSGFVTGLLGLLHPALAFFPAVLSNTLLAWLLFVARSAATAPFASTTLAQFPAWIAMLMYIPLTLFAVRAFHIYGITLHTKKGAQGDGPRN